MNPDTLLLFDIDGTLLLTGGAGERALRQCIPESLGVEDDMQGIEIAGRTDSGIARQVFRKHGIALTDEALTRFHEAYLRNLLINLETSGGCILPGMEEILWLTSNNPRFSLGLLTGNLRKGADAKLSRFGIHHHFAFGAFADDHHDRNALGPFALERAHQHTGVAFAPSRVFVIGDTAHDIACARAIGAQAVAVATGKFSVEELEPHRADHLFRDFSNVEQVMAIWS
jgi:phosphoglycolate phosphatase-like HAD superfamily hydrolase